MRFWADLPSEQWIYVAEELHHLHPWGVYVCSAKRAQFTTEKEAVALRDRLLKAFEEPEST
jgi:hypothetical protein